MPDFSMITTRGGDEGKSSLLGGERRSKSDEIFSVLGEIDELTSALGVFRAALNQQADSVSEKTGGGNIQFVNRYQDYAARIRLVQDLLQKIGGLVALPIHRAQELGPEYLGVAFGQEFWAQKTEELEAWENEDIGQIRLTGFILPGDTLVGAYGDMARSVCRRLERSVVTYVQRLGIDYLFGPQKFINRLSDYLFVVCRWIEL